MQAGAASQVASCREPTDRPVVYKIAEASSSRYEHRDGAGRDGLPVYGCVRALGCTVGCTLAWNPRIKRPSL